MPISAEGLRNCWSMQWKILTLRATQDDLLSLNRGHLYWGLFWVWLAGIGRAWDNPSAPLIMRSGLPSVVYVFALTTFLWAFIFPLGPKNWGYKRLLTFISMTGIVGLLYAVPLEMMMPPLAAADGNTIFLFIVALWRVLMLGLFLFRTTELEVGTTILAFFLPLTLIINVLIWNERFEKTFAAMGGLRYVVSTDPNAPLLSKKQQEEFMLTPIENNGRTTTTAYRQFSIGIEANVPKGFREIQWDDPQYLPPSLLMSVLRPLGTFASISAPILLIAYVVAVIAGLGSRWLKKS